MLPYLKKFNELPADLRSQVSAPEVMSAISELEKKYNLTLATLVMRVMVKDVSILDLSKFFVLEHSLEARAAEELTEELKTRVFHNAADYLGFSVEGDSPSPDEPEADWTGSSGSVKTVKGSNFFFSPEDEEEVKELTQKLDNFQEDSVVKKEEAARIVNARVEKIVNTIKINFSSNELHSRLKQVLSTYVKGVRNRIDTKQTLLRGVDEGGLALNDSLANKVLDIAEKVINENEETLFADSDTKLPVDKKLEENEEKFKSTDKPKQLIDSGERDVPYDFAALKNKEEDNQKEAKEKEHTLQKSGEQKSTVPEASSEVKKEALESIRKAEAKPAVQERKAEPAQKKDIDLDSLDFSVKDVPLKEGDTQTKSFNEINTKAAPKTKDTTLDLREIESSPKESAKTISVTAKKTEEPVLNLKKKVAPQPSSSPRTIVRSNTQHSGKVKMDDVKYVPKLTGPVDELKELNLEDFRRLGPDAEVRTKKIQDKVSFLEQDNYSQRLDGIKAWRQSPVNKLYLSMGQDSITQNQSINAIIKARMNEGSPVLSQEEFNAIMELNKNLRF